MEVPQVRSPDVAFVFLGSIPRNGFVFPVGEMSVCTACVWALVSMHTALFGLIQSGSVTEGFEPCWGTGQSARLANNYTTPYVN